MYNKPIEGREIGFSLPFFVQIHQKGIMKERCTVYGLRYLRGCKAQGKGKTCFMWRLGYERKL
jgi:hypothetical protein